MKNDKKNLRKRFNVIGYIILFLYVIVYPVLSVNGRYSTNPVASGRIMLESGIAVRDVYVWEPKYIKLLPYDYNILGCFYFGFIWVDRSLWHKNEKVYKDAKLIGNQ